MKLLKRLGLPFHRVWLMLSLLGPGLITASADNDAPGIATYSMAGSTYGYGFLWLIVAVTVGELLVQEMAARMGTVTGKGTADLIRERFGVRITFFAMACLLLGNLGTTVAQFAGVAAVAELFGLSRYLFVPLAGVLLGALVLRSSYRRVEKILLLLSLSALGYIITAFMLHPPWGEILKQSFTPSFHGDTNYLVAVLATVGTTITPWGIVYLQASVADKGAKIEDYARTRLDVVTGAAWGNVVSAFIIICTAATLYVAGVRVETAEQAARALEPLAGSGARYLFSIGLLGASLLAGSVLPLSTTYAVCEAFGWERGLDRSWHEAPIFYGLFVAMIIFSVVVVLIPSIPLFPLMWLMQALNAILLPVMLVLVLKLASNPQVMGRWINRRWQNALAGVLLVAITAVSAMLFLSPLWSKGG